VAAGLGERLGSGGPKAFVMLAGRPMLDWSIDALRASGAVDEIVVALPPGHGAPSGTVGAPGGAHRSLSVRNAFRLAQESDVVLVHDAARPLLTPELVNDVVAGVAGGADAAIAGAPVTDTIKEAGADGVVVRTLDRQRLWAVQTPQAFRRDALARALAGGDELLASATDDAWLVERAGGRVRVVEAPRENLKVTTPLDLEVAELLLARRNV
jgi:2-C-methyl-D-erythritol 4-phosphate cytidylyltransferase